MTYFLKAFCPNCGCRALVRNSNCGYNVRCCEVCKQFISFTTAESRVMDDLCKSTIEDGVIKEGYVAQCKTEDEFYYAVHQEIQERKIEEEEKRRKREEEKLERAKQSEIKPGLDYQGFIIAFALMIAGIIITLIAASCNAF